MRTTDGPGEAHNRCHRLLSSAKRFCNASNASSSVFAAGFDGAGARGAAEPPLDPLAAALGATVGGGAPVAAAVRLVRTTVALSALVGSIGGVSGRLVSKGGIAGALVGVTGGTAAVLAPAGAASDPDAAVVFCTRSV